MNCVPDLRCEENEKKLKKSDKQFIEGYREAIEDMKSALLETFDQLGVKYDTYIFDESTGNGKLLGNLIFEKFSDHADNEDKEMTAVVFDSAEYLADDEPLITK